MLEEVVDKMVTLSNQELLNWLDEVPAIDVTNDNIKAFKDALATLTD